MSRFLSSRLGYGFVSKVFAFVAIAYLANIATAADAKRPNILFLFGDDQSTRTLGCYPGSWSWVRTPNLDALASSGVRFQHCYLGSWCMPSRASLLTGLHPHSIQTMQMSGAYPGSSYDPAQCRFWPSVFRAHGYQTVQIGKWHTGVDTGYGRDWDYQLVWNRPKHPDDAKNYYKSQIVARNGIEEKVEGYSTDNYTDWACDYIGGKNRDPNKPWYLWLCYGAIHGPNTPAERHLNALKDAPVELPGDIFGPRPEKPAYLDKTQAWFRGPDGQAYAGETSAKIGDDAGKNAASYSSWVRKVNECNLALDEGIGRVMAALKGSGQLENTLVVYSADQGFAMGEHGMRAKIAPYEASYASALIVARPGTIPQGKVCSVPVNAPDLVQTFFAQAGIAEPWKMHGRDLTPLLLNPEAQEPDRPMYYEHMGNYYGADTRTIGDGKHNSHDVPPWIAVRRGPYKYIRNLTAGEMEEIYDLQADPRELTNLALKPEHKSLLAELRDVAIAELRRTDAPFVDNLPPTRN
jgi:arylsulfatase A-like enzyme